MSGFLGWRLEMARLRMVMFLAVAAPAAASVAACTQQARAPESCAAAVARAGDDLRLGIQGGAAEAVNSREIAKVHIYRAKAAAESGNEAECWRQLGAVYLR